jgi:hypothetical protein
MANESQFDKKNLITNEDESQGVMGIPQSILLKHCHAIAYMSSSNAYVRFELKPKSVRGTISHLRLAVRKILNYGQRRMTRFLREKRTFLKSPATGPFYKLLTFNVLDDILVAESRVSSST